MKAMELEAAKEILAEVFRIRSSEVDEMIRCRFEAEDIGSMGPEDRGLWPQEFCLGRTRIRPNRVRSYAVEFHIAN
ncbi:hypothetical protein [Methanothrix soehngenii]|uniref:hypothetical protein n=1 Tax=Methanothrix soehngenii TaxID=2223 RepID=UPI00300C7663